MGHGTFPVDGLCQDFVIINGLFTPGVATVRKAGSPRKIDEQAGAGLDGARTLYMGRKLARPEIDVYIWDATHFIEWEPLGLILAPPPFGVPPIALSISHPLLTAAPSSISAVLCEDAGEWVEDDSGGWMRTIHLVEWRAPRTMMALATPAIPGTTEGTSPPDAQDVQIQALTGAVAAASSRHP